MFALSAALLGARFRSNDALLGASGGDDGCNPDFEVPAGVNMGRRRSRAVLYQLSGHYKPEKIKTKLKLNNVSRWFRTDLLVSRKKQQQQIAHTWHGTARHGHKHRLARARVRAHTRTHKVCTPQKGQLPKNAHVLFSDSIIWHDE